MALLCVLFSLCLLFAAPTASLALYGRYVLEPVRLRRPRGWKPSDAVPRTKYYLIDFFSLSFLLALALAVVLPLLKVSGADEAVVGIFSLFVLCVSGFTWFRAMRILTRSGVTDSLRRFVYTACVIPLTFGIGFLLIPGIIVAAGVALFAGSSLGMASLLLSTLGAALAAILLTWLLRHLSNWICEFQCEAPINGPFDDDLTSNQDLHAID